jgi:gamma-glutamyltranspeptidase/glutathione hydrolase
MHNWLVRIQDINRDVVPTMAAYLYPGGEPLPVGFLLKNSEYVDTLEQIATRGGGAFYSGPIARAIAERVQAPPMAGSMSIEDLATYTAIVRPALCGDFRQNTICSAPPPSSGLAYIMIAGLYDELLEDPNASQADKIQSFVDAQRLAYADRDYFVADPDYADIPVAALIDPRYIAHRATERFPPDATPVHGDPLGFLIEDAAWNRGADTTAESVGTTHLSIVDVNGNAVSMTASVGWPFGSFRMTGGFLLNNTMTDFAAIPTSNGQPVINAVEPGKRPRSSMSPTILFDENGELLLVTGSPGGNSIIAYATKTILAVLDWGLSAQSAADFPNIVARGDTVRVENSVEPGKQIAADLVQRGYQVQEKAGENSGIHLIVVRPDALEGGADKRREGTVQAVH